MIHLRDFSFRYPASDRYALRNVSFDVGDREIISVIGPSGAGKSTLGYAIAGLLAKHFRGGVLEGIVELSGNLISADPTRIGYVFQETGVQLSGITESVAEEIGFSLEQIGLPEGEIRKRIDEQISIFRLETLRDRHPGSLSGGESQIVALAAEAAKYPELFILDEPSQALDARNLRLLREAVQAWRRSAAVIIIDENNEWLDGLADRTLFLNDGRQVFFGPFQELVNSHLDLAGLDLPSWIEIQRLLNRHTVTTSYRQSLRWLKSFPTSH
ncbi:MAG TPA: ABC transporter ATP-binding protein [Bacteroidota bacterium]|nr:ABC transporter ATP-binding protein [Bacteroidota bacterium]